MTTLRRCAACPTLIPAGRYRCGPCARRRDQARGTTAERGYGSRHQRLRAADQSRMDEEGWQPSCWRCLKPIDRRPDRWALGHCDQDRSTYHGPECTLCNNATSGRANVPCPHPSHRADGHEGWGVPPGGRPRP